MTHYLRCPLGNSKACQSRYWASKNNLQIRSCEVCDHAFIQDDLSDEDLSAYYSGHEKYCEGFESDLQKQKFPGSRSDAIRYLSLIQSTLPQLRRPIAFLEVGAGWAYASRIASSKGWSVDAIEYSPECVSSLSYTLPKESIIHQGSFESYCDLSSKTYDAILMSQVLEHALDPANWLSNAFQMLRPGGCLVVAVPQFKGIYGFLGARDPYITPPEHLNFFTRRSLGLLANRIGFEVVRVSGYSRIPFYNIKRRFKFYFPSILIYRLVQFGEYFFDQLGLSAIQIQVLRKSL
jgi:2-polyprenyl-3-methyl-5-hydroxy-6-metoxy-1,4-benzoquinol methylase